MVTKFEVDIVYVHVNVFDGHLSASKHARVKMASLQNIHCMLYTYTCVSYDLSESWSASPGTLYQRG